MPRQPIVVHQRIPSVTDPARNEIVLCSGQTLYIVTTHGLKLGQADLMGVTTAVVAGMTEVRTPWSTNASGGAAAGATGHR